MTTNEVTLPEVRSPKRQTAGTRRDYALGAVAGFIIGLLLLPILKTAKPSLYDSLQYPLIPIFVALVPIGLVIASWISERVTLVWQLAKFVVIGGMNTLVDIGILALLSFLAATSSFAIAPQDSWFHIASFTVAYYSLYKACSFLVANISSYFWNKFWTFNVASTEKTGSEFANFFLVSLIGFLINTVTASSIFALKSVGGLNHGQWGLVAAAMGSISGLAWNFVGYKFFVFKR